MNSTLCDELGIKFPLFAFGHCRDVIAAVHCDAAARLAEAVGE